MIANCIHDLALGKGASILIIGSENSGQVVTALHRLQEGLAPEETYDMILVQSRNAS